MADALQVLDLTGAPDRPTVKLPGGDFEMRLAEELTFQQFSRQVQIGKQLIARAGDVDEEGVLDELQALVIEAGQILLVDLSDEAAADITPGMYLKISGFFNQLAHANAAEPTVTGSNSVPGASDSTETPEAD